MPVLIDTSVLGRVANPTDPLYAVADHAVDQLRRRGEVLVLTPQVLVEFRNVATRPTANNGLGYSPAQTDNLITTFEASFSLLPETSAIYPAWKVVTSTLGVIGKTVHDARLVAVCHVYRVTHLLTFNVRHVQTLSQASPGLVVIDPATV